MAARKKVVPQEVPEQPSQQVGLMSLSDQVIALAQLPEAERIEALKAIDPRVWYVAVAQNDDGPDGFECFYKLIFSKQLPAHAREWVEGIYKARTEKKGTQYQTNVPQNVTTTPFTPPAIGNTISRDMNSPANAAPRKKPRNLAMLVPAYVHCVHKAP